MEVKEPVIKDGFTNVYGRYYEHVREIKFTKEGLLHHLGKFVAETEGDTNDGALFKKGKVYIYQSYDNPNVGYRIYEEFGDYKFNGFNDDRMIESLQSKQSNIRRTEFPTGVVTVNNYIIGQEIVYYPNNISLYQYSKQNNYSVMPTKLYLEAFAIVKEMFDQGIGYLDIHARNLILVKENNLDRLKMRMIDFSSEYMEFDEISESRNLVLVSNFTHMIAFLNQNFNLDMGEGITSIQTLEQLGLLLEDSHKYQKRKNKF